MKSNGSTGLKWAGAALALLALTVACAPTASPATRPAADFAPAATSAPIGHEQGGAADQPSPGQSEQGAQPAQDFAIKTVTGERFSLAERRGKVVGVLFLASWCGSCVLEAEAWGKVQREFGEQGLEVLLVSADPSDTPADLARFRQWARSAPERHWAIDKEMNALVLPFRVRSLDTTLIFDREGRLVFRDAGPTPYERLKQELEQVL